MSSLEKLIKYLENRMYGDLIVLFFESIAIIFGFIFVRKDKIGILFLAYIIFDFIICFFDIYFDLFSSFTRREVAFFIYLTNNLISLVELLIYFYFFFNILHNSAIIKFMRISATIFIAIIVILITTKYGFLTNRFSYISSVIGAAEFLFLIPPCLVYFYELFQNNSAINLHQRPSFWIVTGIFIYSVTSVPYYMVAHFITKNHYNYWSITYFLFFAMPFTINFIFLTRAFLCKKTLTI